jgi:hypothetical protein
MERQFWRNHKILHPFLRRVAYWESKGVDLFVPRERFRDLCKMMNLVGGTTLLDTLDTSGVRNVVDQYAATATTAA